MHTRMGTARAPHGHYMHVHYMHVHCSCTACFGPQYMGACLVTYDGHVMLHHLYTGSDADVKRTVLN